MAVAIAFLCENALKQFKIMHFYDFELKWLLQHLRKKRDSHGPLKCIEKLKITPKSC